MSKKAYRTDIDGLRALAVISVIFFHAEFSLFSGGFIGVDVFFVISGFLITQNITYEISTNTFSFSNFYIRRLRRLFPAMFVTLVVTFILAIFLFSPQHLARLGKSIIFSIFSASNFLFWKEAGYFDTSSEFKPLLHFWSLAVEEQFYVIWPSVLLALSFFKRKWLVPLFIGVASLVSIYCTEKWLLTDHAGAYYLAPFRVSEFAIGAICVWLVKYQPKNKIILELLNIVGLVSIILPVFYYSDKTMFPGVTALLPCSGAGLLIFCGSSRYSGRLLSNPISVYIGLISYSAYLIHWPIIVFYKYWKILPLTNFDRVSLSCVSLALAAIMFKYIETPFRRPGRQQRNLQARFFCIVSGALVSLVLAPAIHVWLSNGWSWRLPYEIRTLTENVSQKKSERFTLIPQRCREDEYNCMSLSKDKLNVVVLGDSHGVDGYNALKTAYPDNNYILASAGGCLPVIDSSQNMKESNTNREKCIKHNEFIFSEWEGLYDSDIIVFSSLLNEKNFHLIKETITYLRNRIDVPIIILGSSMVFKNEVPTLVVNYGRLDGAESYINSFALKGVYSFDEMLGNVNLGFNVKYISQLETMCPAENCKIFIDDKYDLLTYDKHHLSLVAAQYWGKNIKMHYPDILSIASAIK